MTKEKRVNRINQLYMHTKKVLWDTCNFIPHQKLIKNFTFLIALCLTDVNSQETEHKSHHHDVSSSTVSLLKEQIHEANELIKHKQFIDAEKILSELYISMIDTDANDIKSLIVIAQADNYYGQKHYEKSIKKYKSAISYLSHNNKNMLQHLARVYKMTAQAYKRLEDRKKTVLYYKKAVQAYTELKNDKMISRTLNTLAEAERHLNNYVVALEHASRSIEIQKTIDDPEGFAKSHMVIGTIYRYIGRFDKSLHHIRQALQYYKSINLPSGIAKATNQIGLIYSRSNQYDLAKSFYQMTIDLPKEGVLPSTIASALRELAFINLKDGQYELAKTMVTKAREIYKKENEFTKDALAARIIGNIYLAENNETKAIKYYRESLKLATRVGSKLYQIKAQIQLAKVLIEKDNEESIRLLKQAIKISHQINDKYQILYAYRIIRQAEKHQGNITESLHYAEAEIELHEVLLNEEKQKKLLLEKASLHSLKMEMEIESLKERVKLDQLQLAKKSDEIALAEQTKKIYQLQLTKNKYASFALSLLLLACISLVIFIYRQFIDSRKQNKELDYLATRDPLTNCYNRRILIELLNRDFNNIDNFEHYSIIMADIDYFKTVNDTYGHNTGDLVLKEFSTLLKQELRKYKDKTAVRFGGEEFCLVLPSSSLKQAIKIAETIRQKVAKHSFNEIPNLTCSFGVTSIEFNAKTPTDFINQADAALYKSKRDGRNRVAIWSPDI